MVDGVILNEDEERLFRWLFLNFSSCELLHSFG